ncbi:MAG: DUF3795 domain-containing protein [Candidatus Coatesbacteria bacterium]|nr:DUF3795 domain-containing protein [Candidatus Coatesbacteria bacterium]
MNNGRYDSYCGIYCGACEIVHEERNGRLSSYAETAGVSPDEMSCHGCKSDTITKCCKECEVRACAISKGFATCAECEEVPCELFAPFKVGGFYPLYVLMMNNLENIKHAGIEEWRESRRKRWKCEECGTPSWWYQKVCDNCGAMLVDCEAEADKIERRNES